MEAFLGSPGSWLGLFGTVGLSLAGYLASKFVVPFLQVGNRRKMAEYISIIADDLIDELRMKYPDRKWLEYLDEALAKLIEICEIPADVARRAIQAAAARK